MTKETVRSARPSPSLKRYVKIVVVTLAVCIGLSYVVVVSLYQWFQGRLWREETQRYAESAGGSEAMALFKKGHKWKYVIDGERDESSRLNRKEGEFEVFAVFYQPQWGAAHRFATKCYVDAFNEQMVWMSEHPEKFLPKNEEE